MVYQARALYNSIYKTVLTVKDNCTYGANANSRLFNSTSTTNENISNSWSVDLFPNPTSNEVNVVSKAESENLTVVITDVSGKVVITKNLVTSNFICKLDLSLNNGIYLVTITNTKNEKTTKKLVIAK